MGTDEPVAIRVTLPTGLRILLIGLVVPPLLLSLRALTIAPVASSDLLVIGSAVLLDVVYVAYWVLWPRLSDLLCPIVVVLGLVATITLLEAAGSHQETLEKLQPFAGVPYWIFSALVVGYAVPNRWLPWAAGGLLALVVLAQGLEVVRTGVVLTRFWIGLGNGTLATLVGITASTALARLVRSNAELRAAREALAATAVQEERARFARDLHDLLGHTLSLMVVKLALALRLQPPLDGPARAELEEVESLAREALEEVREVADGYRRLTLAGQLRGARVALAAAAIDFEVHDDGRLLPADVETALAWTVREAVTNVIRHSMARSCRMDIRRGANRVTLEVVDDGVGMDGAKPPRGLAGLEQRLKSCGGWLEWGSGPAAGFMVRATLPLVVPVS